MCENTAEEKEEENEEEEQKILKSKTTLIAAICELSTVVASAIFAFDDILICVWM